MTCDFCDENHATENHSEELRKKVRAGKSTFIVEVIETHTYRVWAEDSVAAQNEVYWQNSSQRPFPAVDDLGIQSRYEVK